MRSQTSQMILLGISGTVIAMDRSTGMRLWTAKLKGSEFVNVVTDGDLIYAGTRGEIYCLDPTTGSIRWHDNLKGLGWGLVAICAGSGSPSQTTLLAEKRRQEEAAKAAAAG